jgi:hypothetical protein
LHAAQHSIHILGVSAGGALVLGFLMAFDFWFFSCVFGPAADGRADGLAEAALDFFPEGAAFADFFLSAFLLFYLSSLAFFIGLVFFALFALAFIAPDFRLFSVFCLAAFEP